MKRGFDTTPKPEFLRAMQNQRWTVAGALSELVDNSFGPGRGNAKSVQITHDTQHRIITVLDDGRGMEAVGRLFQLGNTIGRTPGDIGLYGSGGTMAVLWLASEVEVWTLREGQVSHDSVNWPWQIATGAFPMVSNEWTSASLRNTPTELLALKHGTLIRLHLARERSFFPSNVQRDLAQTYSPALRMGKELLWTTIGKGGETRPLADPLVLPNDPTQTINFDITVDIRGELLGVHGRIGMVEGLSQAASKVVVGYGPRVILKTRDCYSSPDGSEKYIGTGITGWLQLGDGWQPYLATTKDAMNDQPAWEALMGYVFQQIRPLLVQVDTEEQYLLLDEIGLQLEKALDGRAHVDVPRDGIKHVAERGDEAVGRREGTKEPDKEEEPTIPAKLDPTDREGDKITERQAALTKLLIIPESDQAMDRQLCRAEISNHTEVMVSVNKDHAAIQMALQTRPVNRMALNLLVTREIAAEVAADSKLQTLMFPPRIIKRLDDLDDASDRPRLIARLLMDRVKEIPA